MHIQRKDDIAYGLESSTYQDYIIVSDSLGEHESAGVGRDLRIQFRTAEIRKALVRDHVVEDWWSALRLYYKGSGSGHYVFEQLQQLVEVVYEVSLSEICRSERDAWQRVEAYSDIVVP